MLFATGIPGSGGRTKIGEKVFLEFVFREMSLAPHENLRQNNNLDHQQSFQP